MDSRELYIAEHTMGMRLEEVRQEVAFHRLRHQRRKLRPGWVSRLGCWLLCQLGGLLVAMGERLQRYGPSQMLSFEGEPGRGN
jgi:hypothetical protein